MRSLTPMERAIACTLVLALDAGARWASAQTAAATEKIGIPDQDLGINDSDPRAGCVRTP